MWVLLKSITKLISSQRHGKSFKGDQIHYDLPLLEINSPLIYTCASFPPEIDLAF